MQKKAIAKGTASLAKSSENPMPMSLQFETALLAGSSSTIVAVTRPPSRKAIGSRARNPTTFTRGSYPRHTVGSCLR
jgi:hypothetical protein